MNQTQKKYAVARVDEMLESKLEEVKEKLTTPSKRLDNDERIQLIRSKKVWLKKVEALESTWIHDRKIVAEVFDFSKYEWPQKLDVEAYNRLKDSLTKQANKVKDAVMLGESSTALSMIQSFEKRIEKDG